jgi:phosphoglycolate phosphatase
MLEKTTLYSETHQVVDTLQSLGMSLGIVSTKWRQRILDVLEREELVDAFSVIVGGDDVTEHKPDPEGLLEAMRLLDVSPEQTAYVGDSPTDAHAAQRASTSFVAVLSGVTKAHEFDEFSALGILQNVGEISAGLLARADTIRV